MSKQNQYAPLCGDCPVFPEAREHTEDARIKYCDYRYSTPIDGSGSGRLADMSVCGAFYAYMAAAASIQLFFLMPYARCQAESRDE